jgi:hypothetical protein
MTQLYQLTRQELGFLAALARDRDLGRKLVELRLVNITEAGLTLTGEGLRLLEQAHVEGVLPRFKKGPSSSAIRRKKH